MDETDILIIDEISICENSLFVCLNRVLKAARNSKKPLGGVQLVVTGDVNKMTFTHCTEAKPVHSSANCLPSSLSRIALNVGKTLYQRVAISTSTQGKPADKPFSIRGTCGPSVVLHGR